MSGNKFMLDVTTKTLINQNPEMKYKNSGELSYIALRSNN